MIKVISIGQNIRKSSILSTFWTANDFDRFHDDMAERERLEKKRDSEKRERGIKTERQADGFTLLIIKLHLLTKFLHIKSFYGFYRKKISAFCLTFLDFLWPHNLPLK